MFRSSLKIISFIVLLVVISSLLLQRCQSKLPKEITATDSNNEFVGDASCKSCHTKEHALWEQSHHFMAMQPPNDSTVKADFNNTSFTADGVTSRFYKKDGQYFINTQGEDGQNHDYPVKYTFGFTPLQQYLVEFPGGRMQVPRVSWDAKAKKWYHQYAGQKIPSHDWLHWTGNAQNWNTMCASCHSTNLQKNYSIEKDSYATTYSSINVSCESCHGAGKKHIEYIKSDSYKNGVKSNGSYIHLTKASNQNTLIATCTPCHARRAEISASRIESDEMLDNYIPEIPTTEFFHADGQVNDEDYIYTSFLQSKMFRRGVTCSNCHNPHSAKPVLFRNETCMQCHAKTYDSPAHDFHPKGIEALDCKSCHMPGKIYMGNDLRHDHSFRVPRPDLSVKYGTPNACNNCHTNKTNQWASDAIIKWYGPARKYHFAEDLIPGSKMDAASEAHLLKLLPDTTVPTIVKATAAHYLGNINTEKSRDALLQCLSHPDAQVRYRALKSLTNFDFANWMNTVGPLLTDKVRAVRIAAAELFESIPAAQIPAPFMQAYRSAANEEQNYLLYQADFAIGNLLIADHYFKLQDYANAEKFYLRGLAKDSLMNYARLNLSTVYNTQGKNDKALEQLMIASRIDPSNERIYYNLGLLYNELKDMPAAEKSFAKAVSLKSNNPKLYYNYGLLLNELDKTQEAKSVLLKGIAIQPAAPELYYALCFVYIKRKEFKKAQQSAVTLKQLAPDDPAYQELFKNLGL